MRSPLRRWRIAKTPPTTKPTSGDDRQRHVQVEDLLDEALVGVERRVEEDQRERQREHRHGGDREGSSVLCRTCFAGGVDAWRPVSPRGGSRRPRSRPGRRSDRIGRGPSARCRSGGNRDRPAASSGSVAPVAAIISGTTSGSRTSGTSRSRARELTAIEEIRVPVAARPRSASSEDRDQRAAGRGRRRGRRGRRSARRPAPGRQQVDEQRRRLGGEEDAAVDRREPDRVEAALLALGDEEAVDPEHRGEQQRRPEHAGGEAAGEAGCGRGRSGR